MAQRTGGSGPKYRQIADELRVKIERGDYLPGARLPTKAELMAQHQVAVNTVERAIEELRKAGIVETAQGAGMFVREAPVGDTSSSPVTAEQLQELVSEMATLREDLAVLQAQVMNLYHSTGQPYPYEGGLTETARRAAG